MIRKDPKVRKEEVLNAAIKVAKNTPYTQMTRLQVSEMAECAEGTINRYYGTMNQLRKAVMRRAVRDGIVNIVSLGLALHDTQAMESNAELRDKCSAKIGR